MAWISAAPASIGDVHGCRDVSGAWLAPWGGARSPCARRTSCYRPFGSPVKISLDAALRDPKLFGNWVGQKVLTLNTGAPEHAIISGYDTKDGSTPEFRIKSVDDGREFAATFSADKIAQMHVAYLVDTPPHTHETRV